MKLTPESRDSDKIKKPHNPSRPEYVMAGIMSLFFILFCILNFLYPLYADDWGYFLHNFEKSSDYNIVKEIVNRQYNQYFNWGGRVVVHSIAHFILWLGYPWYNLLNTLVFILLLYLIYKISNYTHSINPVLFTLLTLLVWFATPSFNYVFFWKVGAANYLWSTLIILLFIYPYYTHYISGKKNENGFLRSLLFFLAGIIAGWTNENMVVGLAFFIVALIILLKYEKRPVPIWIIFGLCGVLAGGVFMLSAPGNYIRAEVVSEELHLSDKSLLYNIGYRVLKVGYRYLVYILPVVILYSVVFFFYRKYADKDVYGKTFRCSILFFVSAHAACLAMVGSAIFPQRAIFGIIALLVTSTGILFANTHFPPTIRRTINRVILPVVGFIFIVNYCFVALNFCHFNETTRKREIYLDSQKKEGNKYIIFTDPVTLPSRYQIEDMSDDPDYWMNRMYSVYHEIDSVKVLR